VNFILATRTKIGAVLEYEDNIPRKELGLGRDDDFISVESEYRNKPKIELSIDEWLGFIRALYKSSIDKWEEKYGEEDKSDFKRVKGYNAYPQNWEEFMKAIEGIKPK
jgi:hypothetical protein